MHTGAHICLHLSGACNVGEVCWLNLACHCQVQCRLLLFCEDKNTRTAENSVELQVNNFLFIIQVRVIGGKSLHVKL